MAQAGGEGSQASKKAGYGKGMRNDPQCHCGQRDTLVSGMGTWPHPYLAELPLDFCMSCFLCIPDAKG